MLTELRLVLLILYNCDRLKPGFHLNASACVGKQPIMVATASTEHSYWLALAFVAGPESVTRAMGAA